MNLTKTETQNIQMLLIGAKAYWDNGELSNDTLFGQLCDVMECKTEDSKLILAGSVFRGVLKFTEFEGLSC